MNSLEAQLAQVQQQKKKMKEEAARRETRRTAEMEALKRRHMAGNSGEELTGERRIFCVLCY